MTVVNAVVAFVVGWCVWTAPLLDEFDRSADTAAGTVGLGYWASDRTTVS